MPSPKKTKPNTLSQWYQFYFDIKMILCKIFKSGDFSFLVHLKKYGEMLRVRKNIFESLALFGVVMLISVKCSNKTDSTKEAVKPDASINPSASLAPSPSPSPSPTASSSPSGKKAAEKSADSAKKKTDKGASSLAESHKTCARESDKRTLDMKEKATKGCLLNYTKLGSTQIVAESSLSTDYCQTIEARIVDNLEKAGFACKAAELKGAKN